MKGWHCAGNLVFWPPRRGWLCRVPRPPFRMAGYRRLLGSERRQFMSLDPRCGCPAHAPSVKCKDEERQPQIPFGFAQGRLSAPLRFVQDDDADFGQSGSVVSHRCRKKQIRGKDGAPSVCGRDGQREREAIYSSRRRMRGSTARARRAGLIMRKGQGEFLGGRRLHWVTLGRLSGSILARRRSKRGFGPLALTDHRSGNSHQLFSVSEWLVSELTVI
jgi:hypothetical protein